MSRGKLERARDLIKAGRYEEARSILEELNHPLAYKWIAQLNQMTPAKKANSTRHKLYTLIGFLVITSGVAILCLFLFSNRVSPVQTALIPTLAQLPTIAPSNTQPPTPTPSATSTPTTTVTPSPTITSTPDYAATEKALAGQTAIAIQETQNAISQHISMTQTVASSLLPTAVALPGCHIDDFVNWSDAVVANGVNLAAIESDLKTRPNLATSFASEWQRLAMLPYPSCVSDARQYLLNTFEEFELSANATAEGNLYKAESHYNSALLNADMFLIELDWIIHTQVQLR